MLPTWPFPSCGAFCLHSCLSPCAALCHPVTVSECFMERKISLNCLERTMGLCVALHIPDPTCHPSPRPSSPGTHPAQLLAPQTGKCCCSQRTCSCMCPGNPCSVWAMVLPAWCKNSKEKGKSRKMKYLTCLHFPGLVLPEDKDGMNSIQHVWVEFPCKLQEGAACPENITRM